MTGPSYCAATVSIALTYVGAGVLTCPVEPSSQLLEAHMGGAVKKLPSWARTPQTRTSGPTFRDQASLLNMQGEMRAGSAACGNPFCLNQGRIERRGITHVGKFFRSQHVDVLAAFGQFGPI